MEQETEKIEIKPLSVNDAWKGRRFKSQDYKDFEDEAFLLLPSDITIPEGPLKVTYIFGLSSKSADWDNPIKPFQDILCKAYGFNDKMIIEGTARKVLVKPGDEFIEFKIESFVE